MGVLVMWVWPLLILPCHAPIQVFGIQLAAHVIHQYPVPESMGVAKDIFARLTLVAGEVSPEVREDYFLSVLPSLALLCKAFPPLCADAAEFLVHLTKLCQPTGGGGGSSLAPILPNVRDWEGGVAGCEARDLEEPLIKAIKRTFSEVVVTITA